MSRNARLHDILREMAETTTVHGIPKIISAKSIRVKLMWLSIFLGLFGYLSFNLYNLFIEYQSWPVQTRVSLELGKLQFPSISFCNVNPIKLSKLQDASPEVRNALLGQVTTLNTSNTNTTFESGSGSGDPANISQDNYPTDQEYDPGDLDYYPSDQEYYHSDPDYYHSAQLFGSVLETTGLELEIEDEVQETLRKKKDSWIQRTEKFEAAFAKEPIHLREQLGHNLEDMLVRCSFDGRECFPKDFMSFLSPTYGNCYTLEKESFKTRKQGPAYGLWLSLNLELPEYITSYSDAYGIKLVIHEPGTYAFPSEEGLIVSSSEETLVGLRKVDVNRINTPNKDCETGDKRKEKYGISYTMSACTALCKHNAVIDNCGCIPWESATEKEVEGIEICDPSNKKNEVCRLLIDEAFSKKKLECNCKPPCNESVYQKTVSGRLWPNDEYLKDALLKPLCSKRNLTYLQNMCANIEKPAFASVAELYKQSFMQVVIYYEDLNYEKITEELTYDSYRFLSDVGGMVGLFIGASLLSFAEVIQLLIEICIHFYRKVRNVYEVKRVTSVETINKKDLDLD